MDNNASNDLNAPGIAGAETCEANPIVSGNTQCAIDKTEISLGAALTETSETVGGEPANSQSLVDIANNTFKELCKTLENEQTKLLELEERRKKLQEEMQRLKHEIEEEKHAYRLNLIDSISDPEDFQTESQTSLGNSVVDTIVEEDGEYEELEYSITDEDRKLVTPYVVDESNGINDEDCKLETCYEVDESNGINGEDGKLETCYEVDEPNEDEDEEYDPGAVTQRYLPKIELISAEKEEDDENTDGGDISQSMDVVD